MILFVKRYSRIIALVLTGVCLVAFAWYFIAQVLHDRNDRPPVFDTLPEEILVSVNDGNDVILKGITASDNEDGDVTGGIIVSSVGDFGDDMTRPVTFAAFDSMNRVTQATTRLKYTDYRSPEFVLKAPLVFNKTETERLIDYIGVTDMIDGDLSSQVRMENNIETSFGEHPFTVSVKNSAGDISRITFKVIVRNSAENQDAPTIVLSNYLVYLDKGDPFDAKSFVKSVTSRSKVEKTEIVTDEKGKETEKTVLVDEELTADDLRIANASLKTEAEGTYYVKYTAEDADGRTSSVILTVVVR